MAILRGVVGFGRPVRVHAVASMLLALCVCCVDGDARAQRAQASAQAPVPARVEAATLKNGTTVFIHEDHRVPLVAIDIGLAVGGKHDPKNLTGLAQLVAELLLNASTRHVRRDDRERVIRALGLHPWKVDIDSGADATHIRLLVPARAFELALWLESDRVANFADGIDPRALDRAIEALQTAELTRDKEPRDRLRRATKVAAYGGDRSFISGSVASELRSLTAAHVRAYAKERYGADRLSVAVVGAVKTAETRTLLEKYFGGLPRASGKLELRVEAPDPGAKQPTLLELEADVKTMHVCLAWRTAAYGQPDDVVLDVAARLLYARLERRMFPTPAIADWINVLQASQQRASVFYACVALGPQRDVSAVRSVIDEELARLRRGEIDPADLEAAKNVRLIESAYTFDDAQALAHELNSFWRLRRDPEYFWKYRASYAKVDAPALLRVVRSQLGKPPQVVVGMRPGPTPPQAARPPATKPPKLVASPAAGHAGANEAFRFRPPAVKPLARFSPALATSFELASGARALVQQSPESARILLRVNVLWQEKPPCCQASSFLNNLIYNARFADETALRDRLRRLGAWANLGFSERHSIFTVRLLPGQLEAGARALVEGVLEARMEPARFEVLRGEYLEARKNDSPSSTLNAWSSTALFDPKSRLHVAATGRAAAVSKLTFKALLDYKQRELAADSFTFLVVGPVPVAEARAALERATNGLRRRAKVRKAAPAVAIRPGVTLVDDARLDKVHTVVYVPLMRWGETGMAESSALSSFFGWNAEIEPNIAQRFQEAKLTEYWEGQASVVTLENGQFALKFSSRRGLPASLRCCRRCWRSSRS